MDLTFKGYFKYACLLLLAYVVFMSWDIKASAEEVYTTEVCDSYGMYGGVRYEPLVYTINATSELVGYVENNSLYVTTIKYIHGNSDTLTGYISGNGNVIKQNVNYELPCRFSTFWDSGRLSAQCMIFDSYESAMLYATAGSTSGLLNGSIENGGIPCIYDENIEMPEIVIDSSLGHVEFNNACDEYNIEMQGRWWSVDDIEMYKEDNYWHYKYHSVIKNDLSTWVEISERLCSVGTHKLYEYGDKSLKDLLEKYPVDERSFTGGTNAVGNFFTGYQMAKDQFKILLESWTDMYVQPEIYVRYWYMDDNNVIHYGRWCHAYKDLYKSGYTGTPTDDSDADGYVNVSDKGLTDDEKDTLESTGTSIKDLDFASHKVVDEMKTQYETNMAWFSGYVEHFANSIGQVPDLFARVFSFLPKELVWSLGALIGAVIILRILGR